jgi:hypothetical protein
MQGHYQDGGDRRCLMGALDHLQLKHHIPYAGAVYFLRQALSSRQCGLVNFNDRLCASVAELRSVIMKARALALEDAETARSAAAMERTLLAEVERYLAAAAELKSSPLSGLKQTVLSTRLGRRLREERRRPLTNEAWRERIRSSPDSPLEGSGFEISVPRFACGNRFAR